jgi:GAF domain-containing protein
MTTPVEIELSPTTVSANEQMRLDAIRRYDILDTPPDGAFDRIAEVAARLFDVPVSTVSIVDEDRVWFKAAYGLDGVTQVGTEPGLCASVVTQDEAYVVPDALTDARTLAHPLVVGEFGLRFYAAAPVVTHDGYRLGSVTVIDFRPRQVDENEQRMLHHLAGIVMDEMELRLASMRAVAAERQLRQQAERETARVEHTNRMLRRAVQTRPGQSAVRGPCTLRSTCPTPAEVKLGDLTGTSAWACLEHAGEALAVVPGAFVATPDAPTIASLSED